MKNKVRLIDINIVSSYMGQFLTAIVAALVFAITISALTSKGGVRDHLTLVMGVAPVGTGDETLDYYEPIRCLLAKETGRSVTVHSLEGGWDSGCELYITPVEEFLHRSEEAGLTPLYTTCRASRGRDSAVLISRPGWDPSGLSALTPADVIFAGAGSPNGCWLQLHLLEKEGFAAPGGLNALNFAPVPSGGSRVVFEVLMGGYTLGACRKSDLDDMVEAGSLREGEVVVVRDVPALPERIIACRKKDQDYYSGLFQKISVRLSTPTRSPRTDDTAELLEARGIRSLRPVTSEELSLASDLFAQIRRRNSAGQR